LPLTSNRDITEGEKMPFTKETSAKKKQTPARKCKLLQKRCQLQRRISNLKRGAKAHVFPHDLHPNVTALRLETRDILLSSKSMVP
jgi:hypothetical protein